MYKVTDLKDDIEEIDFIRCVSISKHNCKHKFQFNSDKVISKILTNFANRYVLSLDDFKQFVTEYKDEIRWYINEEIFIAIDTIIENTNCSNKNWKISNVIWIAILQNSIFENLRELYFEMVQDRNSKKQ